MTTETIINIIKAHGVVFEIVGNKIIADGDNITGFSKSKLKIWLGY